MERNSNWVRDEKFTTGRHGRWVNQYKPQNKVKQSEIWRSQLVISTIFIDSIPGTINNQRLGDIFKQCGLVVDSFILINRRRRTNTRFGFVMFDEHYAAMPPVNQYDGVWLLKHRIFVRLAHANLFQGARYVVQRHNTEAADLEVVKGTHESQYKIKNQKQFEIDWLRSCMMGIVKDVAKLDVIETELKRVNLGRIGINPLGGVCWKSIAAEA
ncbi:hypothetical protein U1Q18_039493, partial [Sarracenia purpurea var. burkii]